MKMMIRMMMLMEPQPYCGILVNFPLGQCKVINPNVGEAQAGVCHRLLSCPQHLNDLWQKILSCNGSGLSNSYHQYDSA